MKLTRQLYLGLFLFYALALALLFFSSARIPSFYGTLSVGLTTALIYQIFRCRTEGFAFSRLIPAILVVLVCLSHLVAFSILGSTAVTAGSPAFLFYLITTLGSMVISTVGFFLK